MGEKSPGFNFALFLLFFVAGCVSLVMLVGGLCVTQTWG